MMEVVVKELEKVIKKKIKRARRKDKEVLYIKSIHSEDTFL